MPSLLAFLSKNPSCTLGNGRSHPYRWAWSNLSPCPEQRSATQPQGVPAPFWKLGAGSFFSFPASARVFPSPARPQPLR